MLQIDQIQELVDVVSLNLKKKKTQFHSTYEVIATDSKEVAVHAEGDFPSLLISKKYPSETDQEFQYRKDNYQAVTKPYWGRALNAVQRIWNPTNSSVEIEGDSNGEVQNYLFKDYPVFGNIMKYFMSVVTPNKINYPNSVVVVKPNKIPTKERNGEMVNDNTKKVSPVCVVYHSDCVYAHTEEYTLLKTAELSMVKKGSQAVKEGLVLEFYDDTNIYKIIQTGKKDDYVFDIKLWYTHDLDHQPSYVLGGEPKTQDGLLYYVSYFEKALEFLNKAVCQNSTLDATTDKNAYPTRVYFEADCDNPLCGYKCSPGHVMDGDDEKICPKCNGTSKRTGFSPMRDYVVDPNIRQNEEALPFPPLQYVSPGTEILEWLDTKITKDIENAFAFINIDVASQPNGQTATEAKIDREELFSFLLLVSGELFMLLGKCIDDIIQMRFNKDLGITIRPPDEFTIRDSADLADELKTITELNVSPIAHKRVTKEWLKRRFNDDVQDTHILDIVYAADIFTNTPRQEIALGIANGTVQKWQQVLHDNIYAYLDKMIRNEDDISDIDQTVDKLIELAKSDTVSVGNVEDILNGIT